MIPARDRSLADRAFEELERRLVTLELPPGKFLLEKELCDLLGMGRTPVREAVQRLASCGLLNVYPRKGIQVAPIEAAAMAQVLESRRVLERLLVVKATERADSSLRNQLAELAMQLDNVGDDSAAFFRLDRELDERLSQACANPYLVQALAPLHIHCRRLWYLFRAETDTRQAARLHAQLARAVSDDASAGALGALNGIIAILDSLQERLANRS